MHSARSQHILDGRRRIRQLIPETDWSQLCVKVQEAGVGLSTMPVGAGGVETALFLGNVTSDYLAIKISTLGSLAPSLTL